MIVCNFPSIIQAYRTAGWRAEHLFPGHDPAIDPYGDRTDRDVDIVFAGGYSRHHTRRAAILEAVSSLARKRRVVFHLDRSRVTTLAEYPIGRILPLTRHRRPAAIRAASAPPVCDRALYGTLSGARVVLNGAVDMAGNDRGNMRCIEAMGCGAVMVSDAGNYPEGMIDGRTMFTCKDAEDTVRVVEGVLALPDQGRSVAAEGLRLVRERYSKAAQWKRFQHLVENK